MLQFMGSQRVRHDLVTTQQKVEKIDMGQYSDRTGGLGGSESGFEALRGLLPEKGGEKKEKLLFMEPLLYCGLSQIALSSFSRECFANGAEATWKSRRGLSTG